MKTFHSILAAFCVAFLAGNFTGCKSSPNQIAYTTTAATVETVDTAMRAWAQYVHTERARIASLQPIDQGSQGADLTRLEGRVRDAYGKYQQAAAVANVGISVADGTPAAPEVAAAAAALVQTISSNLKH